MRPVPKNKWWQFNKHESKAPRFRDTMTEERASESGRSTSKDEDHHGYERWRKDEEKNAMKETMIKE